MKKRLPEDGLAGTTKLFLSGLAAWNSFVPNMPTCARCGPVKKIGQPAREAIDWAYLSDNESNTTSLTLAVALSRTTCVRPRSLSLCFTPLLLSCICPRRLDQTRHAWTSCSDSPEGLAPPQPASQRPLPLFRRQVSRDVAAFSAPHCRARPDQRPPLLQPHEAQVLCRRWCRRRRVCPDPHPSQSPDSPAIMLTCFCSKASRRPRLRR